MARSRNIKPGFFKNESLAECSPLARLLFAGLWCLADRAGRLEDRPKRIRAEVLPYDDGSVDDMLVDLHRAGFILRYQIGGQRFIQVLNFEKHQNPHHREAESTIPAPVEDGARTVRAPDKPGASLGLSQDKPITGRADSLIPDSLNLIPDKPSAPAAPIADTVPEKRNSAVSFKTFVAECQANGEKTIPEDDTVFDWARKAGVSDDFLRLAWIEFRDRFKESPKRYKDWRQVFRNCVRDNWYGIWFCDESGNMVLTSKGRTIQQAMREAA